MSNLELNPAPEGKVRVWLEDGRAAFFDKTLPPEEIEKQVNDFLVAEKTPQQETQDVNRLNAERGWYSPPERHIPGYTKPVPVEPGNPVLDYLKTGITGLGKGVAGIGDAVTSRPVDWIARNVFNTTPPGSPTPLTDIAEMGLPAPVQGFERTRELAEDYGPDFIPGVGPAKRGVGLVGRGIGYGGEVLRNLLTSQVGQQAGKYGSQAGEWIGEKIGGERGKQIGGDLGGTLAGVFTPTVAVKGAEMGTRGLFFDKDTEAKLAAYRKAGVTPTMGAIGNKSAALIEDTTGTMPIIGDKSREMRQQQLEEMNQAGKEIAEGVRGGPNQGVIDADIVGKQGREAVNAALLENRRLRTGLQQGLEDRVGGDTPVATKPAKDAATALEADPKNTEERLDLLRERVRQIERNRDQPIDKAKAALLDLDKSYLESVLQTTKDPGIKAAAEQALITTLQQVDENTGTTYAATRKERSDLRGKADNPLDANLQKPVEDALTEGMKQTAEQKGVPRQEFDEIQTKTSELYDEQARLKQSEAKKGGSTGYNALFSKGNSTDRALFEILQKHAPEHIKKALADEIELRTRGKHAAGETRATPETRLGEIADWWNEHKNTKDVIIKDPELRARMDALAEVDRIERNRPTRSLPSKGNTFGLANVGIGGTMALALQQLHSGNLTNAALAAIPSVTALLSRKFSDPEFTARIADKRNLQEIFNPQTSALSLHGARQEAREEERRKEPLKFTVRPRVGPPTP